MIGKQELDLTRLALRDEEIPEFPMTGVPTQPGSGLDPGGAEIKPIGDRSALGETAVGEVECPPAGKISPETIAAQLPRRSFEMRADQAEAALLRFVDPSPDETVKPTQHYMDRRACEFIYFRLKQHGTRLPSTVLSREVNMPSPRSLVSSFLNPGETFNSYARKDTAERYRKLMESLLTRFYADTPQATSARTSLDLRLDEYFDGLRERFQVGVTTVEPGDLIDQDARSYADLGISDIKSRLRNQGNRMLMKIVGPPDSGKSSLAQQAMEEAKRLGSNSIYVDAAQCVEAAESPGGVPNWRYYFAERVDQEWLSKRSQRIDKPSEIDIFDLEEVISNNLGSDRDTLLIIDNFNLKPETSPLASICRGAINKMLNTPPSARERHAIMLLGFEDYAGHDEVGSHFMRNMSREEVERVSLAYPDSVLPAEEVYEIAGGQPLLTQGLFYNGLDEQFMIMARNHLMKLARMIARSPEAQAELEKIKGGSTGGWAYALPALGVVKSDPKTGIVDWSCRFYRENLSEAVELYKRAHQPELDELK